MNKDYTTTHSIAIFEFFSILDVDQETHMKDPLDDLDPYYKKKAEREEEFYELIFGFFGYRIFDISIFVWCLIGITFGIIFS